MWKSSIRTVRAGQRSRISNTSPREIPRHKRIVSVIVAFAVGASFYFVLPDSSRAAPTHKKAPLSPRYFTPATVISNEDSGPTTKLLKLAIPPELIPSADSSDAPKSIWSVFIKDDDIQVERPYTPLHGIDEDGNMLFWIRRYPKGEVGRWLHSKIAGDQIELRGPLSTWNWKEDAWDEVVMISGGTGFTPFFQLFHSVISNPSVSPPTHFTLLHGSPTPDELPPASLLNPFFALATRQPKRLKVNLFIDAKDEKEHNRNYDLTVGRLTSKSLQQSLGILKEPEVWWRRLFLKKQPEAVPKRILFLVCGPEPMINAIAGPYGRNLSQGAVGGILGELGYTSDQVYKL